ncbi:MAG: hypothetical protein DME26_22600 [Verrucomicrobia bacterium]|nr:MAG: hypothetical protein DME26_22600 [Verrucomicrobiota bacterium]
MHANAAPISVWVFIVAVSGSAFPRANAQIESKEPKPLVRAHAHNDYEHKRPLLDALAHGFCGVEADIYLVEGKLLVAHDRNKVQPERTLQALYLDPLRERVRQNGGRVYRGGPSLTLLVDVKSDAEKTYAALREVLKEYDAVLTKFSSDRTETNAITVIISGNRAKRMMTEEKVRYAAYDGRLEDLDGAESKDFIPLVSDNWSRIFSWKGVGPFPAAERGKLSELINKAHQQGRRVRFWATPDAPAVWSELLAADVDLINTDDLAGLDKFLRTSRANR